MKKLFWLAVGVALGAGAPALAQAFYAEGEFNCLATVEWVSQCERPRFAASKGDGAAVAEAEYAAFHDCVDSRAKADSAYAAQAVLDSADKELAAAQADAEAAGYAVR